MTMTLRSQILVRFTLQPYSINRCLIVKDIILDSIEREVVRRTQDARQALQRMNAIEIKKEENMYATEYMPKGAQVVQGQIIPGVQPQSSQAPNIVQYVQVHSFRSVNKCVLFLFLGPCRICSKRIYSGRQQVCSIAMWPTIVTHLCNGT